MKPRRPKIKFKLNPKLDAKLAWDFYRQPVRGGYDFWRRQAVALHPDLENLGQQDNPKKFLKKYIEDYYRAHDLAPERRAMEKSWAKRQKAYFKFTDEIFNQHRWPKGKYIGYVSIFGFGPRFLKDKTFQVPYRQSESGRLFTIAHEMLHFMFYHYCRDQYPEIYRQLNTERGRFWDLAEVFNAVLHQTKEMGKIHGPIKKIGYPAHQDLIKKAQKAWFGNLDQWLKTFGVNYVKNP